MVPMADGVAICASVLTAQAVHRCGPENARRLFWVCWDVGGLKFTHLAGQRKTPCKRDRDIPAD